MLEQQVVDQTISRKCVIGIGNGCRWGDGCPLAVLPVQKGATKSHNSFVQSINRFMVETMQLKEDSFCITLFPTNEQIVVVLICEKFYLRVQFLLKMKLLLIK